MLRKKTKDWGRQPSKRNEHRINSDIISEKVRLVGDNIEEIGVYSTSKAMSMANSMSLDLVEISSQSDPPVCKILDYDKFLYQKKKKEIKSKVSSKVVIKEIRFGPRTDSHDFEFKKKHAIEFLESGAKLKAFVFFKGRAIIYKDQGEILLLKLAQELEEYGKVDKLPKLEGKRMIMFMSPKKKS
ncbi:translation initiation factor IF-3 [Ichthyobacterium seriolicida]|uniref:Translation initiation factor IF-3 n=1 Tax=Ichthyobacterium seriolicida TaxID=242600 RepID=A0A1J1DWR5_9FLAO|nr:translation initiation factor IF-3 [Ichthyobacterium seriolicida]BAV94311.1 translation initiation factor 3 [Ichthyobacterium seriolicida]